MGLLDNINDHLRKLPESQQAEVFDFVNFLESRKTASIQRELDEWSSLSLDSAMVGISETEDDVSYSEVDIKESY